MHSLFLFHLILCFTHIYTVLHINVLKSIIKRSSRGKVELISAGELTTISNQATESLIKHISKHHLIKVLRIHRSFSLSSWRNSSLSRRPLTVSNVRSEASLQFRLIHAAEIVEKWTEVKQMFQRTVSLHPWSSYCSLQTCR